MYHFGSRSVRSLLIGSPKKATSGRGPSNCHFQLVSRRAADDGGGGGPELREALCLKKQGESLRHTRVFTPVRMKGNLSRLPRALSLTLPFK